MSSRRRRSSIAIVCLLVAAMSVGMGFLGHTDDGCPTEIHCAVCLTHLTGLAIRVSMPPLAPPALVDTARPDPTPSAGAIRTPSTLALRGPPAA